MMLEDHAGDIVRKARLGQAIALEAAAQAAGVEPDELARFEDRGVSDRPPNLASLGVRLGLSSGKLEAVRAGWLPKPVGLEGWREVRQLTTESGGMAVHSYLVWDEVTREAALFDTGWDAAPILDCVAQNGLILRHLFITHSHEDHLAGLEAVRRGFPKVRLHSSSPHAPVEQRNRANDFIHLGSLRVTHRDTPGHAADGTTYVIGNWPEDAPHVAVVGDALFAGSMGKATGSAFDLARRKVREQILSLPADTLLCPGHGPLTTVAEETAHNPFF
jgi:glyoxylase-like metal-dependent hydrolase (beta-lactamase superfamily II)